MKVVRSEEVAERSEAVPGEGPDVQPTWLEGPFRADRLDVGLVHVLPGGRTPPHAHLGGQVMVVTNGRGFVETGSERVELARGDVVICPPGEVHVHGASDDAAFAHLTVTTGDYEFPEEPTAAR